MWNINYQTLIMMTADAVRYVSSDSKKKDTNKSSKGASGALGYFQSRLK